MLPSLDGIRGRCHYLGKHYLYQLASKSRSLPSARHFVDIGNLNGNDIGNLNGDGLIRDGRQFRRIATEYENAANRQRCPLFRQAGLSTKPTPRRREPPDDDDPNPVCVMEQRQKLSDVMTYFDTPDTGMCW